MCIIKLLTCVLKVLIYMRDRGSIFLYAAFETGRRSADTAHMQATSHNQTLNMEKPSLNYKNVRCKAEHRHQKEGE